MLGGAAVGLPALANVLIARRNRRARLRAWGDPQSYAWTYGEISFHALGEGSPIVLVHSFGPGHDSEEWRAVAEALADSHAVFTLDLVGWGHSDKPVIPYDDELYIQLLRDFLEDIVGSPCTLAAAGLPAAYAIQVAIDQPNLVKALALVVPSGLGAHGDEPDLKDAFVHRLLRLPILGTSALNLFTSRASLSHYLKSDVFHAPEQADAGRLERLYRSSHQPGAHAALAAFVTGYLNHPVIESLSRVQMPVWLAWGRDAAAPPVETADLWLQHLPQATLEVFDDCGSLPHLEVTSRFTAGLEKFLRSLTN